VLISGIGPLRERLCRSSIDILRTKRSTLPGGRQDPPQGDKRPTVQRPIRGGRWPLRYAPRALVVPSS
jgi:hypothetical protein